MMRGRMVRFLVRLIGYVLIAAGFVSLVIDGARSIANSALQFTALGRRRWHPCCTSAISDSSPRSSAISIRCSGIRSCCTCCARRPRWSRSLLGFLLLWLGAPPEPGIGIVDATVTARSIGRRLCERPPRCLSWPARRPAMESEMFFLRKKTELPQAAEALPGRAGADPDRRAPFPQQAPARGSLSRRAGDGHLRAGLLLGSGAQVLADRGRHLDHRRRLHRRLHAESDL